MDKRMYLVQRGDFNMEKFISVGKNQAVITHLIRFDYMGAAEFEWGSIPKSLTRMIYSEKLKFTKTNIETPKGVPLWIVSSDTTSFDEAKRMIDEYLEDRSHTDQIKKYILKEPMYLENYIIPWYIEHDNKYSFIKDFKTNKPMTPRFTFWFDINNDFMFFLGAQDRASALEIALENTKRILPKKE